MKRFGDIGETFNDETVSLGETPSAGAKASARGLAKIAAMMAARGRFAGRSYLSEAAWTAMHDEATEGDIGFGITRFSQGGVNLFVPATPEMTEYLWTKGYGGRDKFFLSKLPKDEFEELIYVKMDYPNFCLFFDINE